MRATQDLTTAKGALALGGGPSAGSPASSEQRPQATMEFAPVFLHASFRSGSTWLWSKIRSAPTTLAYYEIFHEALATMTRAQIAQIDLLPWDTRHPVTAAYFLEFLPLLSADGGIAGLDRRRPLDEFIPRGGPDGALAASDKAYVDLLVAQARARQRIPVLSCTRSLGRARAFRRSIGGKTIVLHRNLFHQWASFCWQRENGNSYFMDTICALFDSAKHDPFLQMVASWYDLAGPPLPDESLFSIFLLLHLYLLAIAYDPADLVIDLPEMVADRHERARVEAEIGRMIACDIDLSDVREHCDFAPLVSKSPQKMWDTIDQLTKMIPVEGVSAEGLAFVYKAKGAAFAEWARFEFYNHRTRAVLVEKIDLLEAGCAHQSMRADALKCEVETARSDLAAAASDSRASAHRADQAEARNLKLRADLAVEVEARLAASAQKGAIAQRLAQAEAEADTLRGLVQATNAERDAALAKVDDIQVELADAVSKRDQLDASLAETRSKLEATLYQRARRRLLPSR